MNAADRSDDDSTAPETLAAVLAAVGHPMRMRALAAFRDGALSPVGLTRRFDEPRPTVGAVAYHVRKLESAGLIALSETIPRRGAIEHRFELTPAGVAMADALEALRGLDL
ncbi:MAG: helix-turn-helix domain-containing protein [Thermoleophilaceae bacterium]